MEWKISLWSKSSAVIPSSIWEDVKWWGNAKIKLNLLQFFGCWEIVLEERWAEWGRCTWEWEYFLFWDNVPSIVIIRLQYWMYKILVYVHLFSSKFCFFVPFHFIFPQGCYCCHPVERGGGWLGMVHVFSLFIRVQFPVPGGFFLLMKYGLLSASKKIVLYSLSISITCKLASLW